MADFQTHLTYSTVTGVLYGGALSLVGFPLPSSALAGGVCALSGMLPDIDSKSSRSLQECLYLAAGIFAMLTVSRLREFPINGDIVIFLGAFAFLFVRFILGTFVRNFTVHRGMIHSIPAALIAGEIAFLFSTGTPLFRCIKAGGITLGFLSHLLLDEIYSVDASGRAFKLKKSFGTAFKFFDKSSHKNLFVYGTLVVGFFLLCNEPYWTKHLLSNTNQFTTIGTNALQQYSEEAYRNEEVLQNKIAQQFSHFFTQGKTIGETNDKDFSSQSTEQISPFATQKVLPQEVQDQFREPTQQQSSPTPTQILADGPEQYGSIRMTRSPAPPVPPPIR